MKRFFLISVCIVFFTACDTITDISLPEMPSLNPFGGSQTQDQAELANNNIDAPAQDLALTTLANEETSALSTEMSEMALLTGNAPRFETFQPAPEPIESVTPTTEIKIEEKLNPETPSIAQEGIEEITEEQPIETASENLSAPEPLPIENAAPAPTSKPDYVSVEPVQKPAAIEKADIAAVKKEASPQPSVVANLHRNVNPNVIPTPESIAHIEKRPAPKTIKQARAPRVQETVTQEIKAIEAPTYQPLQEKIIEEKTVITPTKETTNETALFTEQDLKLSSAKGCPVVQIMPAGRSITYFENELSGQMVARAVINEIRGGCEIVSGGLEIDLDLLMHGKIGDKGRFEGNKDMEAFMTFPYFIAVSNPQGLPVDKKILATAMRFKPVVNDLQHAEKITQFIPMDNVKEAANYKILVGFQLTRKQLEYNRARNLNRVNNMRISPDTIPAARRSLDPLAN